MDLIKTEDAPREPERTRDQRQIETLATPANGEAQGVCRQGNLLCAPNIEPYEKEAAVSMEAETDRDASTSTQGTAEKTECGQIPPEPNLEHSTRERGIEAMDKEEAEAPAGTTVSEQQQTGAPSQTKVTERDRPYSGSPTNSTALAKIDAKWSEEPTKP